MKYFRLKKNMMDWEAGSVYTGDQIPGCLYFPTCGVLIPVDKKYDARFWEEISEEEYKKEKQSPATDGFRIIPKLFIKKEPQEEIEINELRKRVAEEIKVTGKKPPFWMGKPYQVGDIVLIDGVKHVIVPNKEPQEEKKLKECVCGDVVGGCTALYEQEESKGGDTLSPVDMEEIEKEIKYTMHEEPHLFWTNSDFNQVFAFLILKELTRRLNDGWEPDIKTGYNIYYDADNFISKENWRVLDCTNDTNGPFVFKDEATAEKALTMGEKYFRAFYGIN